ncbi:MAG: cobalamin biosynthesis protein CbiG [Planctomycetota bacterium]|nr:cobalamin biosynthesis protein CbiG [Planctomycetota bacterium]
MKTAILVLSQSGLNLARGLRASPAWPETVVFGPSCVVGRCGGGPVGDGQSPSNLSKTFPSGEPGVFGWIGPLRLVVPEVWREYDAIVAVMALGIVVRLIGPLAADKRRDPAVVVVDDAGRFAIPVLGGHGAGANDLARRVADLLGATPVITTASDAQGLPAVDEIGRDRGWRIERIENLTRVAAAVVRRQTVAVYQDSGGRDWWLRFGPWPEHFVRVESWDEIARLDPTAVLVISDRIEPVSLPDGRTLVYRPRTLVAGIGCKRGTTCETIAAHVEATFAAEGLAIGSLAAVATVTLKADEPGLIAFARSRGVPFLAYPPEELVDVPGIETPSERVRSKIGIPAVSEPAALRASGATVLLVTKTKGPGVTVAVARASGNATPYHIGIGVGPNPGA